MPKIPAIKLSRETLQLTREKSRFRSIVLSRQLKAEEDCRVKSGALKPSTQSRCFSSQKLQDHPCLPTASLSGLADSSGMYFT